MTMMKTLAAWMTAAVVLLGGCASTGGAGGASGNGLVAVKSAQPPKATLDRFEAMAKERGLNVFARIDHAAGAARIGQTLRPTEVLIFGNPQGGTPFMQCAQTVGIDLPLKAFAWQDEAGQSWLAYNDPAWLAQRHGARVCPAVDTLSRALAGLADAATK